MTNSERKKFRRTCWVVSACLWLVGAAMVYFGDGRADVYGLFVGALGAALAGQTFFLLRERKPDGPSRRTP